jgi:hypothetical protein
VPAELAPIDPAILAAANICPATGLATDYLNHFNEVAMLVEMLPMMPEAAPDILAWRPRPYADHFTVTGFRDKELAIAAYHGAAAEVRARFAATCAKVEAAVADVQARLEAGRDPQSFAAEAAADLYDRIAALGAVILGGAGHHAGDDQAAVDALFD